MADSTVVRLARWLRLLGYDVEVETDREKPRRRAFVEGRILLSRNRKSVAEHAALGGDGFLVRANRTREQLFDVASHYGHPATNALGRCSRCNRVLELVAVAELQGRVWPHVLREHASFRRCPACMRVYWRGGHVERMTAFLERAGVSWSRTGTDAEPPRK